MTYLQLYGEALNLELGSDDTTALFTTARRKKAINDAQQEFAKQTECFTKSVSIPMVDNTREYDLEVVITADDFLDLAKDGVEFVFTDASGNVTYLSGADFPRIDLPTLNREQSGWRSTTKAEKPSSYYIREEGGKVYFGMSEPPSVTAPSTASVTLPYVAVPPDMTGDTNEPFSLTAGSDPKRSLRPWHQVLVNYAAALLEPLRKNYAGEQRQRALFAGGVADYLQRKRPKGGTRITMARDYRGEASGRKLTGPLADPRVWP